MLVDSFWVFTLRLSCTKTGLLNNIADKEHLDTMIAMRTSVFQQFVAAILNEDLQKNSQDRRHRNRHITDKTKIDSKYGFLNCKCFRLFCRSRKVVITLMRNYSKGRARGHHRQ